MGWLKKIGSKIVGAVKDVAHGIQHVTAQIAHTDLKLLGDLGESLGIGSKLADNLAAVAGEARTDSKLWLKTAATVAAAVVSGGAAAAALGGAAAAGGVGAAAAGAASAAGAGAAAAAAAGSAAGWLNAAYQTYKVADTVKKLSDEGASIEKQNAFKDMVANMDENKTYYDDNGDPFYMQVGEDNTPLYYSGEYTDDSSSTGGSTYEGQGSADDWENYLSGDGEMPEAAIDPNNYYNMTPEQQAAYDQKMIADLGAPAGSTVDKASGNILDKIGNVVGSIFSGVVGAAGSLYNSGALGQIITALLNNKELNVNKDLLEKLQKQGTDNLEGLAAEIGNLSQPDLMALAKANPGMLPMLQQVHTEYNKINVDPSSMARSKQSLDQLENISKSGYGVQEYAAAQRVLGEMANRNRGQQEAIKTDLASRGQYGSGQELQARMLSAQANANLASQEGLDIEAQAAKRALEAIRDKGKLGLDINQQEFNQEAEKAKAQDTINKFNTDMASTINKGNLEQTNVQQQNAIKAAQAQYDNYLAAKKAAAATAAQAAGNATTMYGKNLDTVRTGIESRNQLLGDLLKPGTPQATGTTTTTAPGGSVVSTGGVTGTTPTGTTTTPKPTGSSTIDKIGSAVKTAKTAYDLYNGVKSIWDAWSDEDVKKDKKQLSDEDICSVLDELVPMSYKYNDSVIRKGAPKGKVVGVMAQQIERTPAAGIIKLDDEGAKMIDGEKAMSLALASLGSLHNRLKKVEGK